MTPRNLLAEGLGRQSWMRAARRVSLMLLFVVAGLSLVLGSVSHATEPVRCLSTTEATQLGHSTADRDQVPSDSEKGYAHHHGGCHGHQIGEPTATKTIYPALITSTIGVRDGADRHTSALTNPGLRPPIA
jgi:hypothetical protein